MKRSGLMMAGLVWLFVSGCSTVSDADVASVKEADAAHVTNCEFLGTVDSVANWEMTASEGLHRVRNGAKMNAKKLGATHIVFSDDIGTKPLRASGKAYRCAAEIPASK
jgi:hypothetical protein